MEAQGGPVAIKKIFDMIFAQRWLAQLNLGAECAGFQFDSLHFLSLKLRPGTLHHLFAVMPLK